MLTLAAFVLEKFGGDTMDDVRGQPRGLPGPDRRAAGRAGRRRAPRRRPATAAVEARHGLTGTDEAGSGGDD